MRRPRARSGAKSDKKVQKSSIERVEGNNGATEAFEIEVRDDADVRERGRDENEGF